MYSLTFTLLLVFGLFVVPFSFPCLLISVCPRSSLLSTVPSLVQCPFSSPLYSLLFPVLPPVHCPPLYSLSPLLSTTHRISVYIPLPRPLSIPPAYPLHRPIYCIVHSSFVPPTSSGASILGPCSTGGSWSVLQWSTASIKLNNASFPSRP